MGSRAITRPAKRLKPFFWNKLSNPAATVWNDVPSDVHFDMKDLESIFVIDNSPPTPSQILLSPGRKQNVTTLLDITRANNIGARFPMSISRNLILC